MAILGTDDPDAEVAKIAAELKARPFDVEDIVALAVPIEDDQRADIFERSPIKPPDMVALAAKRATEAQAREALGAGLRNATDPVDDEPTDEA